MSVLSKVVLSGSTDGRGILVVPTSTPGTLIHTAHATALDELWVWALADTASTSLTIEYGGTTDGDVVLYGSIPRSYVVSSGVAAPPALIIPGWLLTNSLVLRIFANVANDISIFGYVNRIT